MVVLVSPLVRDPNLSFTSLPVPTLSEVSYESCPRVSVCTFTLREIPIYR